MKTYINRVEQAKSLEVLALFFPSPAFAVHCDNRPNADYSVKEMQGVVSSASVNIWASSPAQHSFDLLCLLCRLCDLPAGGSFLFHAFNHSHRYRLTHVSHCKSPCGGSENIFFQI